MSATAAPGRRDASRFLADYHTLTRVPRFWLMATVGMVSKLAASMTSLSLLLLVSSSYSYGTAGLAVSCSILGQGLTAPLRGRFIDRYPVRSVLLSCLVLHLTVTIALMATVRSGGAATVVYALAAAVGGSAPPVAVMMRSIWHSATDGTTLSTAMALDASMMGAALIVGPVLASWLSLRLSPLVPYAAITAMTVLSVGLVATSCSVPVRSAPPGHWLGPLASPPLRRLLTVNALFVMAVTAVDVVLPMHARQVHAMELTGLYLGLLAVGSVLGSFALGAATQRLPRRLELPVLLGLFTVGSAALAAATQFSPLVVLAVCPVAGLVIGALFATLRTTGGDLAPVGYVTETMSWLSTLDMVGGAAGAAVFAYLADTEGSGTALILIPVLIATAAAVSCRVQVRQHH
ncbi:MFS transporter [Streptomyces monticola]|uniref:MFS transporter n=1 Tax=Streptomyces monticola TaxID=2666263 RepID=A0ABW2JL34_9ACTN